MRYAVDRETTLLLEPDISFLFNGLFIGDEHSRFFGGETFLLEIGGFSLAF